MAVVSLLIFFCCLFSCLLLPEWLQIRGAAVQRSQSVSFGQALPLTHSFRRRKKQSNPKKRTAPPVCCKTDYSPSASDDDILQRPAKEPLELENVTSVFGYPRNVKDKYVFGEIIGSGSYGIVKKCVEKETGTVSQLFDQ